MTLMSVHLYGAGKMACYKTKLYVKSILVNRPFSNLSGDIEVGILYESGQSTVSTPPIVNVQYRQQMQNALLHVLVPFLHLCYEYLG